MNNFTFKKIPNVSKDICTAEQKIAYNFALRYRDFNNQLELIDLIYIVVEDIENNPKLKKYNIDSIIHCFRNGYIDYRKNYPSIITDYETIGKVFFSDYPVSNQATMWG